METKTTEGNSATSVAEFQPAARCFSISWLWDGEPYNPKVKECTLFYPRDGYFDETDWNYLDKWLRFYSKRKSPNGRMRMPDGAVVRSVWLHQDIGTIQFAKRDAQKLLHRNVQVWTDAVANPVNEMIKNYMTENRKLFDQKPSNAKYIQKEIADV